MAYKMRKTSYENLRKAVNKVNRMIDRLNKQYQSADKPPIIPVKRDVKSLVESITSSDELKLTLRNLGNMAKKGSMDIISYEGAQMPRYMAEEIKSTLKQVNKQRSAMRHRLNYDPSMVDTENLGERVLPNLEGASQKRVQDLIDSLKAEASEYGQQQRLMNLRQSYYKSIDENFSQFHADRLKNLLDQLDLDEFGRAYLNGDILDIGYIYSKEKENERFDSVYTTIYNTLYDGSE